MSSIALNPRTETTPRRTIACPNCRKKYRVPTKFDGAGLIASSAGGILLAFAVTTAVICGVSIDIHAPGAQAIVLGLAIGLSMILSIAGLALQTTVPKEAKAKSWLIAALVLGLAPAAAIALVIATGTSDLLGNWMFHSIFLIFNTAAFVCYAKFLAMTARYSGRMELVGTVKGLVIYHLLVPTAFAALAIATPHLLATANGLGIICNLINLLGLVANLVTNVVIITLMLQLGCHMFRKQ